MIVKKLIDYLAVTGLAIVLIASLLAAAGILDEFLQYLVSGSN